MIQSMRKRSAAASNDATVSKLRFILPDGDMGMVNMKRMMLTHVMMPQSVSGTILVHNILPGRFSKVQGYRLHGRL